MDIKMAGHASCVMRGRPGGIRTPITRIWSPVLYPLELLACLLYPPSTFHYHFVSL